ncbi:MAG TPA: dienelactone hydrolase family protein [Planctomycetota bacterium]|nr:dienelactone hydrolase family protein [Planctomycetota bacterium]
MARILRLAVIACVLAAPIPPLAAHDAGKDGAMRFEDHAASAPIVSVTWGAAVAPGAGREVTLGTGVGEIVCRYHAPDGRAPETTAATRAVLWVFGAGGGLGGPAGGVYERLAERLAREHGIASLRLDYRHPGDLDACIVDARAGLDWLCAAGAIRRVALVGHSFGGAVVIAVGSDPRVSTVVAMSSQTLGADGADAIAPRPLLVLHGEDDEVLPAACSRWIHRRAREPKRLILYPGARHGLDQCRDALDRDLIDWLLANA